MPIEVNSIEIPKQFIELCSGWAGDTNCMLRAIDSTGGLTLGNRRPLDCDTDEKWYLHLFQCLSADVMHCRLLSQKSKEKPDLDALIAFEAWADAQVNLLRESYGIEE